MKSAVNYQKKLDELLETLRAQPQPKRLLLHSCCAPCSSYCLKYLSDYFYITVLYYNPNITDEQEYRRRAEEQQRLIREMPLRYPVEFREGVYRPQEFFQAVRGLEMIPEGGERCFACYRLRMRAAAQMAALENFDYFTTTLSISPLKNAAKINEIGEELGEYYHVSHLPSDFKKRGGYQCSVELSREYKLYRQNYCGCVFSKKEALSRRGTEQ